MAMTTLLTICIFLILLFVAAQAEPACVSTEGVLKRLLQFRSQYRLECIWECNETTGNCFSPIGKKVCFDSYPEDPV
jgi:hypothetical protein